MTEALPIDRAPREDADPLPLLLLGVDHRTAPVEVRERLAVPERGLEATVRELMQIEGVSGACVISTCNRVEVIVSADADAVRDEVARWLSARGRIHPAALEGHLYEFRGAGAVEHLCRVASGLESMIVGEPQIAGQVKKAFAASRAAGALDALLHRAGEQTMHVAKKVRSETGVGQLAVSVPYAAVELAKKIFGDLSSVSVLLVGAGEMGELTAEHLAAQNVRRIVVANKTGARALSLASRFGGEAVAFSAFEEYLCACDVVIVSTAAPHLLVPAEQVKRVLEARKGRSLFLIDLSVPRNIDPAAARIEGAYLYDLDDLLQVAAANRELRRQKVDLADPIVAREMASFARRVAEGDAGASIAALQAHVDEIRSAELERCLRRLGPLSPSQRAAVEQLSVQMVNKILHNAIVHLKSAREDEGLLRAIFGMR